MKYIVVYDKTSTGCSAYAPDLPGCVAAGSTRRETENLIRTANQMHIEALREDGEPVPQPGKWTQTVEVPSY